MYSQVQRVRMVAGTVGFPTSLYTYTSMGMYLPGLQCGTFPDTDIQRPTANSDIQSCRHTIQQRYRATEKVRFVFLH